ncbi:MAG: hypothetical protein QOE28_2421 [Solirubrobacteraceae bacterium]|nr:hypothetical protein [Solirubrobacteraceae bacterium]
MGAGCGRGTAADAVDRRNDPARFPVTMPVAITARDTLVAVRPGGSKPEPREWESAGVSPDGRTLLVRYLIGACEWLDGATATESPDAVTVAIRVARTAGIAEDTPCVSSAMTNVTRVTLRRPLRGRVLLDAVGDVPRPVVRLGAEPSG